jgi:hypothetical protein
MVRPRLGVALPTCPPLAGSAARTCSHHPVRCSGSPASGVLSNLLHLPQPLLSPSLTLGQSFARPLLGCSGGVLPLLPFVLSVFPLGLEEKGHLQPSLKFLDIDGNCTGRRNSARQSPVRGYDSKVLSFLRAHALDQRIRRLSVPREYHADPFLLALPPPDAGLPRPVEHHGNPAWPNPLVSPETFHQRVSRQFQGRLVLSPKHRRAPNHIVSIYDEMYPHGELPSPVACLAALEESFSCPRVRPPPAAGSRRRTWDKELLAGPWRTFLLAMEPGATEGRGICPEEFRDRKASLVRSLPLTCWPSGMPPHRSA